VATELAGVGESKTHEKRVGNPLKKKNEGATWRQKPRGKGRGEEGKRAKTSPFGLKTQSEKTLRNLRGAPVP